MARQTGLLMTTDTEQLCEVCEQPFSKHVVHFRSPRDPPDELHQRFDYSRPLQCPDGEWTTWRKALGYE